MSGEALTTLEAARVLGVSRRWVNHLIAAGELPARKFGAANVVDRDALRRYVERTKGGAGKEK